MNEISLQGRILEAVDYNPDIDLPTIKRTQKVLIQLEDDFPNIIFMRNKIVKILVDGDQINIKPL